MTGYLVTEIWCAECNLSTETLVRVLGVTATLRKAKRLANASARRAAFGEWAQCVDGWYAGSASGELRILDLDLVVKSEG